MGGEHAAGAHVKLAAIWTARDQRWSAAFLTRVSACAAWLMFAGFQAGAQEKPQDAVTTLVGTWTGTYTCPQGLTGLTLSITAQTAETFTGFFHFYPPAANSAAREGCFSVRGRIERRRVSLEAGRWITQPEGYVTVDLVGELNAATSEMIGSVVVPAQVGAACSTFELKAVVPAQRVAGICHAGVAWNSSR